MTDHTSPIEHRAVVAAERLRWMAAKLDIPRVYGPPRACDLTEIADLLTGVPAPAKPECIHCGTTHGQPRILRRAVAGGDDDLICQQCFQRMEIDPEECGGAQAVPGFDDLAVAS